MKETERKGILIVEDEGIVADEIRSRLVNLDYQVVGVADTGPDAIRLAEERSPDLVLMDIMLKGEMDGVQAAEVIRNTFDLPVVYLTAYTDDGTLRRAKITQPFGYLIKPFEERELRTTIEISLYNHMMEKRLQESEARYRAVSELSSDFAFSMRVDNGGNYHLEWITDAFTTITGYSTEDVNLPDDLKKIIHPSDLKRVIDFLYVDPKNHDLMAESSEGFEFRVITKEGEIRWMFGYLKPLMDQEGKRLIQCYGAGKDITLRKRAQELIRIQRDLGISLSKTGDLTTALNDLLGATVQVSGIDCGALYLIDQTTGGMDLAAHKDLPFQFIDILHYDSSAPQTKIAVQGKPIYGHYSKVSTPLEDMRNVKGLKALAIIPVKHKGVVVAALNLASRSHDEIPQSSRDALEAIASQIGGIIARVKAEMALKESEEKYRLITETVSEGIIQLDLAGNIEYANNAFTQLFGYPMAEILETNVRNLVLEMHLPEINILMEDVLYGNYLDTTISMKRNGGKTFRVNMSASPMRKDGFIMGAIMILRPSVD